MSQNIKLLFVTCITIFVVTLVGCGKSKDNGQQPYQGPVRTWNDGTNGWGVNPGCNMPNRFFQTQGERCQYIQNSPELNNCNIQARQEMYRQQCMNNGNGNLTVGGSIGGSIVIPVPRRTDPYERDDRRWEDRRDRDRTRTDSTVIYRSGNPNLSTEERHQVIRDVRLCKPARSTTTIYVTEQEIQTIRHERKPTKIKCPSTLVKPVRLSNGGWGYDIPTIFDVLGTDVNLTREDLVAACDCIEKLACDVDHKTDGKITLPWVPSEKRGEDFCDKENKKIRSNQCVQDNMEVRPVVVSAPRPGPCSTVTTSDGVTEVNCNRPPVPALAPSNPSVVVPVPVVQAPVAQAPAPVCQESRVTEENTCYLAKPWFLGNDPSTQPKNLRSGVGSDDVTGLDRQLEKLRIETAGGVMIVARTNIHFDTKPSDGLRDAFLNSFYQGGAGTESKTACSEFNINSNPCPIQKVNKVEASLTEINGSRAKVVSLPNDKEGLNFSFLNLDLQQQVHYVGKNELLFVTTYRLNYDPQSPDQIKFVAYDKSCAPGVETNRVTVTERVIFTKNPKKDKVKIEVGPDLSRLIQATGRTDLDPKAACEHVVNQGH